MKKMLSLSVFALLFLFSKNLVAIEKVVFSGNTPGNIQEVQLTFNEDKYVMKSSAPFSGISNYLEGTSLSAGNTDFISILPANRNKKAFLTRVILAANGETMAVAYLGTADSSNVILSSQVIGVNYIASKSGNVTADNQIVSRPFGIPASVPFSIAVHNRSTSANRYWIVVHYFEEK